MTDNKFVFKPKNAAQRQMQLLWPLSRILIAIGPAGCGKAQPLDSTVWTPNGPKRMGDIYVGDEVCAPDGTTSRVLAVYPQGDVPIYRITFANGDSVEACGDHVWQVRFPFGYSPHRLMTTNDLLRKDYKTPSGRREYCIDLPKPLELNYRDVEIDPYLLGVLLGDGGLSQPSVRFSTMDDEILDSVTGLIPSGVSVKKIHGKCDYQVTSGNRGGRSNVLMESLRHYGLMGKLSKDKFVPFDYLYNSRTVRESVIQGLLDTDGYAEPGSPVVEYTSTSRKLAEDVQTLTETLGGTCSINYKKTSYVYKGIKKFGSAFRCLLSLPNDIQPFRLTRKMDAHTDRECDKRRFIENIEPIGEKEAQCISVDRLDGLYLTDHCVVTHNTHAALALALMHKCYPLWLCRPAVACDEELGFMPGDLNEKLAPWLAPFHDVLGGISHEPLSKIKAEAISVGMLRGRTVKGCLIVDECQNLTKAQLTCILTRLGNGGKIILCGDPDQSDLRDSRFERMSDQIEDLSGVSRVVFTADQCVRDPLVMQILERIGT